jgi:hypothetical protein
MLMANNVQGSNPVCIAIHAVAALLTAGTIAVVIAAAPIAAAAPADHPCSDMGGATQCQRTGNVQIYTAPQDMPVTPRSAYGPFEGYHAGHN